MDTMFGNLNAEINALELSQNSILRMNIKKTIQLIQEYKNEECLWNTFLDDYPNRDQRLKAADRIAKILNLPNFEGKHVLIKFKNLRNSYCQELKKIANSQASDDPSELYKPLIKWFPLMDSFIRPHLSYGRKKRKTIELQTKKITANTKLESCESDEREDWAIPMSNNFLPENSNSYSELYHSENDEVSVTDDDESRPKKQRLSNSSKQSDFDPNQVFLPSNDAGRITNRIEDTYDSFGQYIASLLRGLPPEKALKLQPKIVNMIVDVGVREVGRVKDMHYLLEAREQYLLKLSRRLSSRSEGERLLSDLDNLQGN